MNFEKEVYDIKDRLNKLESKDSKILDTLLINMKKDINKINENIEEIKNVYEIIPKRNKSGIK